MVDAHGQATLVDFGLSKLTADHQTAEVWFTPGLRGAPRSSTASAPRARTGTPSGRSPTSCSSGESPPATPEQLAQALTALPQIAVLDAVAAGADRRHLRGRPREAAGEPGRLR